MLVLYALFLLKLYVHSETALLCCISFEKWVHNPLSILQSFGYLCICYSDPGRIESLLGCMLCKVRSTAKIMITLSFISNLKCLPAPTDLSDIFYETDILSHALCILIPSLDRYHQIV